MADLYIAWQTPMEHRVAPLVASSYAEELRRLNFKIDRANEECWQHWAESLGGSVVLVRGAEGVIQVPPRALAKLPAQRDKYHEALGEPVTAVGVGTTLDKAVRAREFARKRGVKTPVFHSPEVDSALQQEGQDKLSKALGQNEGAGAGFGGFSKSPEAVAPAKPVVEGSEHSDAEAAAAQANDTSAIPPPPEMTHAAADLIGQMHDLAAKHEASKQGQQEQDDKAKAALRQQVGQVLEQVRQQAPILGQLKQASPEAFASIQALIQSVIALGRALQPSTPMQKSEGVAPRVMYHVAPADRTDSIARSGLQSKAGRVYLWSDPEMADWFKGLHESDGKQMQVWKVDASSLPLKDDPEAQDMSHWSSRFQPGTNGGAFYHEGVIPPHRLSLRKSEGGYDYHVERWPSGEWMVKATHKESGEVVGEAMGNTMEADAGGDAYVYEERPVWVHPAHRRRGVASEMVSRLQQETGHPFRSVGGANEVGKKWLAGMREKGVIQKSEEEPEAPVTCDYTAKTTKERCKNPRSRKVGDRYLCHHHADLAAKEDKKAEGLKKALADIAPGKHLGGSTFSVPGVFTNSHDYSHVLSPEHRAAGYSLIVHDDQSGSHEGGDHDLNAITATLHHNGKQVGSVSHDISPQHSKMQVDVAHLDREHRGKGVGLPMYEASMAHAKRLGISHMGGGVLSTNASGVHSRLAAKHGMEYQPKPSGIPISPLRDPKETPGAFDNAVRHPGYVLKEEMSMAKAEGVRPGMTYSLKELPSVEQEDAMKGFDDPSEADQWKYRAVEIPPENIPDLFDETGDFFQYDPSVVGLSSLRDLSSPERRAQFLQRNSRVRDLVDSINDVGLRNVPVGGEGHHRAVAHYLLGRPLLHLRLTKAETNVMDGVSEEEAKQLAASIGLDPSIPLDEFRRGVAHEREHVDVTGGDAVATAKIAAAHLKEDPAYYTNMECCKPCDPLEKGAMSLPAPKKPPTEHHLDLPPGSKKEGGPGGDPKNVGRIKIQHGDGSTSWVQARAGQVTAVADRHAKPLLGHASHPLSSRNQLGH